MWIVKLHFDSGYAKSWSKTICGCETEEAVHKAGKVLTALYNHDLFKGYSGKDAYAHIGLCSILDDYTYSVKEHKGEWNPSCKGKLRSV